MTVSTRSLLSALNGRRRASREAKESAMQRGTLLRSTMDLGIFGASLEAIGDWVSVAEWDDPQWDGESHEELIPTWGSVLYYKSSGETELMALICGDRATVCGSCSQRFAALLNEV